MTDTRSTPWLAIVIALLLMLPLLYVAGYFLLTDFQGNARIYDHEWQATVFTAAVGLDAAVTGEGRKMQVRGSDEVSFFGDVPIDSVARP